MKLCALKELVPGSVITLPKEYQTTEKLGIMVGLEYAADKKRIFPSFVRRKELILTALPALADTTEFEVHEDRTFQTEITTAFAEHKLAVPSLSMTMGCDPEIFVTRKDGSLFPAWEFMPSEDEAEKTAKEWMLKLWGDAGEYSGADWALTDSNRAPKKVPAYWDGAQAEFAPWGKVCLETLHHGTREGLTSVLAFARAKDSDAKLVLQNVMELPEVVLKDTDPKLLAFRCSQSYNIYDDIGEEPPDAREYKFRCAGGHIHIGAKTRFTAPTIEQIVRGLDGVLGVIGVSLAAGIDNPERRKMYGRAGEFRLPKHGIEYRVLSNFWLCHPAIAMLVFELTRVIVRYAQSGLYNISWLAAPEEIQEVINNCDVNGARTILNRNIAQLGGLLQSLWQSSHTHSFASAMRKQALRTILNGVGVVIKDPYAIEQNWQLGVPNLQHCRHGEASWYRLVQTL